MAKYKLKTRKCVAKRFRKTAGGKLKYNSPCLSHLLGHRRRKNKRRLKKPNMAVGQIGKNIAATLNG
jgi:large subunit ribosomal protein L35